MAMDPHPTAKMSPIPKIKQRETRKQPPGYPLQGHCPAQRSFLAERICSSILEIKTFYVAQS
jgi:hypothetical protein